MPNAPQDQAAFEVTLPARWRPWQRRKNHLIYWGVRALVAVLTRLPYIVVKIAARSLAWLALILAEKERRRALTNLASAMPKLSPRERRRIVRGMFLHLGECAAEALCLPRFIVGATAVRLAEAERRVFDEAVAEGKGVVVVCGHIGNWELFGQVTAHAGYDITAIAKPTYDPRLTRLVAMARTRFGLKIIWRGTERAAREMLAVFRRGGLLALLIDQDTKVQGDFAPFFGRQAYTATAPATLALRFDAPLVVAWSHRVAGGHALRVERVEYAPSGDRAADVLGLTALLNAKLEGAIRAHPEQWVWMHERWRRTPDGCGT